MGHDTALIGTIATGFILAFALGFLAQRLRIPPLVGYLAAGIVSGPFALGPEADLSLVQQLAEVGVILLMFGVGIHFSFAQLMAVRWVAVPGALARIAIVTTLGTFLGMWWGWGPMAGAVFGLTLSVASTVVLLRILDEEGAVASAEGRIAVGWLIVEDIAMVLALVLLPALAAPLTEAPLLVALADGDVWIAVLVTLGKVALFLAVMLIAGRRFVPWLLAEVARQGSRELFTLATLAIAIGVAIGAAAIFGVSFALGAFFAGVVISESDLSHQAAADALPLQDAFAVLFFFSVGMLFEPRILWTEPLKLVIVLLLVVPVRLMIVSGLMFAFGHPARRAFLVAGGLAQIGEFSFILAALAISLGVLPREGQTLMLAAALFSITVNPLMVRMMIPLERWVRARPKLIDALERADPGDPLRELPVPGGTPLEGHAVLIGHGRVGRTVAQALREAGIPYVVIDQDRSTVEALREQGILAIFGDATRAAVRERAFAQHARLLIISTPDPFQARHIVREAYKIKPDIHLAVRTHSEAEFTRLKADERVGRAVMGERELAYGLAHYSIQAMGHSSDEADIAVMDLRAED
ncbi:MAG: cation:proton antiporter [Gemmatimonadaceae bacterium]|nr:cation:proton antiporter [Gemmatimonadaceae bacterium]